MKKILIVIDSITCGGAERGLMALLNALDYTKYDVDLLYFSHENEYYKNEIPSQVRVLNPGLEAMLALAPASFVIKHLWDIKHWPITIRRLWFGLGGKLKPENYFRRRVSDWKKMKKHVPALKNEYDAAIAYLETSVRYYVLDKVKAKRYIVWQRTDYKSTGCCPEWDLPYLQQADHIGVLSDEMKQNFIELFPALTDKVIVAPNIIDIDRILELSKENVDFDSDYAGTRIISVGTLRHVKGYDVAMKACKRLCAAGYQFRWYILGYGEEQASMEAEIKRLGIEDTFILYGNKRNPYAYVARSDIFVQCSYREGFSTTVFEAKCLQKPIVITDAPGMRNQIIDQVNGLIAPIGDDEGIAEAIEKLITSKEYRQSLSDALESHLEQCSDDTQRKLLQFDQITG